MTLPQKWATPDGLVLSEGQASATDFEGEPIPELARAHAYELRDASGKVLKAFLPEEVRLEEYSERFHLIRYQVTGSELVKYVSYCYEESTYDTPFATEPERTVVLEGLKPL